MTLLRHGAAWTLASCLLVAPGPLLAQTTLGDHPEPVSPAGTTGSPIDPWDVLKLGAWADAYFGCNFNRPRSNLDSLRTFDDRHDTFTLQMAALDLAFDSAGKRPAPRGGAAVVKVTLQAGDAPAQYYLASGSEKASDAAVNAASFSHIQQAYVGYRVPVGKDGFLKADAGIFLSHVGYESVNAVGDANDSRSLLFQLAPLYHTGVRLRYRVGPTLSAQVSLTNGWNSVIDNNREKSLGAQVAWSPNKIVSATLNWIGGAEQDSSANVRNLFDGFVVVQPSDAFSLAANADVGFDRVARGVVLNGAPAAQEQNVSWYGAALYARVVFARILSIAARGEAVRDSNGAPWLTGYATTLCEGTGTFEVDPFEHLRLLFEARADGSARPAYATASPAGLSRRQTTVTVAALARF